MNDNEGGFEEALDLILRKKILKLTHLEKYLYGSNGVIRVKNNWWKKEISKNQYITNY